MTTANKISIVRILLVPFFIAQMLYYFGGAGDWYRLLAVTSFGLGVISDALDGYIARRYNQRSELGALLDPLADKLLLLSGMILLTVHDGSSLALLPLWLTVTVISRDALLVIGAVVIRFIGGKVEVRPHWIGKVATVLQMTCVLWALLKLGSAWLQAWTTLTAVCTAVSGIIYIAAGVRQLASSPASLPTPRS